ncbi:tRNA pseudouridine(13) synthase TruD [Candidatus Bathyarchaeota archaeon A05DMB-2]|nr:tRNA pseudouridine(13) synthase TruD [Candidatus Bathyarchaeota archaeon A05DMB-2]
MPVPEIDEQLGIGTYLTDTLGIGGVIKQSVDDFTVEEILVDGSKATIEAAESRALGASSDRQRYLLCVLVKRNWDTFIALKNIAKQLCISQRQIYIAGIKDAKAVTAQHLTIEHGSVKDTARIKAKDIELRSVGYVREALSLFYLLGNSFTVKITAIHHPTEAIREQVSETMKQLEAAGGLPNFFGHQRFGTTRPITHLVGKAMVKGDLEEAVMLFLAKPSANEHPDSRQARQELQSTGNFKAALKNFPRQLRFERLMLARLAENSGDFAGAFRRLPLRLLVLFVQAFQSYLFNRFLTERIRNGFCLNRAQVGDWVVSVERSGLPMINVAKMVEENNLNDINESVQARRLRVALPIVGAKQRFSQGIMGQIERQVLEEEGVETENFKASALPELGRRGGLRAVVAPVKGFQLLDVSPRTDDDRWCDATLEFTLLRGCYATVLLREIMKPADPVGAGF